MRKTIQKLIGMGKEEAPPIDFPTYTPHHFIKYLISLESEDDKRLSIASYAMKRSSLFHLFRLYKFKPSKEYEHKMNVLFKGFKRKVAEDVQKGGGKIQTGKSPMSFGLYHQINLYMLKEKPFESVWARAFLVMSWNLILPQFDCSVETADKIAELFFPVLPNTLYCAGKYFAASLIFSFDKIKQLSRPSNPLLSALFCASSNLDDYKKLIYQRYALTTPNSDGDLETNIYQEPSMASISDKRVKQITKATRIPAHVLLLADMQKVINSQQSLMHKIEKEIKHEFDQREVGYSSLVIQQEMKALIKNFESKVINELNELKIAHRGSGGLSTCADNMFQLPRDYHGGRWYHWGEKFRRVPRDWSFPSMTLRGALHRYFLPDTKNQICAMRHLRESDVANIKNGKKNYHLCIL